MCEAPWAVRTQATVVGYWATEELAHQAMEAMRVGDQVPYQTCQIHIQTDPPSANQPHLFPLAEPRPHERATR